MTYLELNRRFVERERYDQNELISAELFGMLVGWEKVLQSRSSVIVAPANFGKTTEMRHKSKQLRAEGEYAVFVALRQLVDSNSLEEALDDDDLQAYRRWKSTLDRCITVFVDSLDEAAAGREERISRLVRRVAEELHWPNEHVQWVISTRPAVLTPDVFEKLSQLLSMHVTKRIEQDVGVDGLEPIENVSQVVDVTDVTSAQQVSLRLFSMAFLTNKEAEVYLKNRYQRHDAKRLIEMGSERGLSGFVRSPGGLNILARIDIAQNPPTSLTDVFERVTSAIGELRGNDSRLKDIGNPDSIHMTRAAQRLAAASLVCQLDNIEMPQETLQVPENALSARLIVSPCLHDSGIKQLLNSQLFIDSGFHQVKMYPEEIRPFLAAKHFSELVSSLEQAKRLLEYFVWTAPSGEQGVGRVYLPMMGWLATLNKHCREVILKKDPQALAFFGDLRNQAVPPNDACEALTESIRRLVEGGNHIGRGAYYLTSENYWQAGSERLTSTVLSLYKQYKDNNWVRDVLTNIATTGKLESLREEIFKRHGCNFTSVLSDFLDTSYFLALEKSTDLVALAKIALVSKDISSPVATLLIEKLSWNYLSPRNIAVLVDNQFSARDPGFEFTYLFVKNSIFAKATEEQLYLLSRGLIVRIAKKRRKAKSAYELEKSANLIAALLKLLVDRTGASQSIPKIVHLYVLLSRVIHEYYLNGEPIEKLQSAACTNATLRLALLRFVVRLKFDGYELQQLVFKYRRLCDCAAEDVEQLNDERLTRIYRELQALSVKSTARPKLEPIKKDSDKNTITSKDKLQLKSRLTDLAEGVDTNAFVWIARWLLARNGVSRYGEINFEAFKQAVGAKIAKATQQGLSRLWRTNEPRLDKDQPNTTYYISAAGLQGLHLELLDGKELPILNEGEIRRALRYAHIEINGYPKWFWPLVDAHPSIAVPELISIASDATSSAVSKSHAEKLLLSIPKAPTLVQEALAGVAWSYLIHSNPSSSADVKQLLKAVFSIPGTVPQNEFENLTLQKMKLAYSSPLPEPIDAVLLSLRSDALAWAIQWFTESPLSWCKAVKVWCGADALAVKTFIFDVAAEIGRDSEGVATRIAREKGEQGILAFEDLFLWTRWAVDCNDDLIRDADAAYTLEPRDHAQRFRDSLIGAIAAATTQAAYSALERICAALPFDDLTVDYIKRSQFELRERQFTRKPLSQLRYKQFESDFRGDVTDTMAFAMAVHADLSAVKYDLEHGEHSLRSFFSELDFCRINKKGVEGTQAGLALEAHFQRLLASELAHHALNRYSVTLESQTAETKRRDVLCSVGNWRASIELKMSQRWTLNDYLIALEQQLVGQYMQHHNATIGFFVVVLQTKTRTWIDPSSRSKLNFQQVLERLSEKAQEIESHDQKLYLRVIGIDATAPDDFRASVRSNS